jgi:uncharacterized membrane protein YdjX (TVP38/TMEM64 family)
LTEDDSDAADGTPPTRASTVSAYLLASWKEKRGIRKYIGPKRIIGLVGLISLFLVGRYLHQQGILSPVIIYEYLDRYPLGFAFAFTAIYVVSVVCAVPTLPLNLAAGYLWGGVVGGVLATAGSGLGAILAFLAARITFGQPLACRFDHRIVSWIQMEYERQGWRFVAFVRINPIFPTGMVNYAFGLTSISTWTYTWATLAFLCPPSLVFAVIGDQAGTFLTDGSVGEMVRAVLVISAAVTMLMALRYATRFLTRNRGSR